MPPQFRRLDVPLPHVPPSYFTPDDNKLSSLVRRAVVLACLWRLACLGPRYWRVVWALIVMCVVQARTLHPAGFSNSDVRDTRLEPWQAFHTVPATGLLEVCAVAVVITVLVAVVVSMPVPVVVAAWAPAVVVAVAAAVAIRLWFGCVDAMELVRVDACVTSPLALAHTDDPKRHWRP